MVDRLPHSQPSATHRSMTAELTALIIFPCSSLFSSDFQRIAPFRHLVKRWKPHKSVFHIAALRGCVAPPVWSSRRHSRFRGTSLRHGKPSARQILHRGMRAQRRRKVTYPYVPSSGEFRRLRSQMPTIFPIQKQSVANRVILRQLPADFSSSNGAPNVISDVSLCAA